MANPVLGKLQGQGLIETTTEGIQKSGAQLAVTPVGAAMQGRGLDSQKMAGTKPSKVNALASNMRDVTSAALGKLREAGRMMEGQESAIAETARRASVLGRVDDQIAKLAENNTLTRLRGLQFTGAELDTDKLTNYSEEQTAALKASIGDLIAGGTELTDSDLVTINKALVAVGQDELKFDPKEPVSLPLMAQRLSALFKETDPAILEQNISQAILDAKAESTVGSLDDQAIQAIFQTDDVTETQADLLNLLSSITGKSPEELGKMQLGDLRSAIDSWKQSEFKDVGTLRETLNDPMASKAERQLAHKELRRLGYVGVTPAEAKIGDLQKQMEEGDTVTIGNETFTVEELFSDPEKLLQIQTWVDNPETAPPEIKTWLEQNKDAINLKMKDLLGTDAGLTGMYERIKQNQETFALDPSIENLMSKDTMEIFLPDLAEIGLDDVMPLEDESNEDYKTIQDDHAAKVDAINKNTELSPDQKKAEIKKLDAARDKALEDKFGDYRKYKFLQSPETAKSAMLLMNNLQTIPGVDGKEIFGQLTSAQMAQIFTRGEYGVNDFIQGLKDRQRASSFDGTNFKNEFEVLASDLGIDSTAGQLANLMDKDLSPYKAILEKAGLKLTGGKLDVTQLRTLIDGLKNSDLQGLIDGSARNMKESLSKLATKLTNEIGRGPELQTELATDAEREKAFREANPGRKNPDEKLREADKEVDKLQKEFDAVEFPYIKATFPGSGYGDVMDQDKNPLKPSEALANDPNWQVRVYYHEAMSRYNEYKKIVMDYRLAKSRLDPWKDMRDSLRNNRAAHWQAYQDDRSKWYNDTYLVNMREENKNRQKVYSDLADLFGDVG